MRRKENGLQITTFAIATTQARVIAPDLPGVTLCIEEEWLLSRLIFIIMGIVFSVIFSYKVSRRLNLYA